MSDHGAGDIEGLHDPLTDSFDTAAIAAVGAEQAAGARRGASRLMGHGAADNLSTQGPRRAAWVTPMVADSIRNGGYLRAMLGNVYFVLPAIGFVLGVIGGIDTSGLAVPPFLALTLALIVLGAFDALSGLAAVAGFALVTLFTGNLVGDHMFTAPPGEQTFVYTVTGLFGLAVLWFAGAKVPHRLRPQHAHRKGTAVTRWAQRSIDYFASAFIGMLVIWLAAWQMPTLTGNRPQELFVTIQDHLLAVKITAFLAILARVALQEAASLHFPERSAASAPVAEGARSLPVAILFWAARGALAFMILWEFLREPTALPGSVWSWPLWVILALFLLLTPVSWVSRRLPTAVLSRFRYPLNIARILVVLLLIQLLLDQLTRHLVNPIPMLEGILMGIGVLLLIAAFLEPLAIFGRRRDVRTIVSDGVLIVLLVLMVYGIIGIRATPFIEPHGVYVAPTGAVFVADTGNNRVVLVHKDGYRQTIGIGINQPADVTADGDPDGYVYIANAGDNNIIRLAGFYNYTVGSHTFSLALADDTTEQQALGRGLKDPQSVSVNGLGDVFVADTGNNRVVEINRKTGAQKTFLTGLNGPLAVLCDPFFTKTVYVANTGAGTVVEVLPNHKRKVLLSGLDQPAGLAEDPWGNFYVSEMGNGEVLEVTNHGTGTRTVIDTGLDHPRGLSVDALGNLFVSDAGGGQVKVLASLREHQLLTHGMPDPAAVAHSSSGTVYVVDRSEGWLQSYDGSTLRTVATGLNEPIGVAAGPHGDVWVDELDGNLLLVSPNGSTHVVLHGLARPRQLWAVPNGAGAVLVAEEHKGRILEVTPSGQSFALTRLGKLHLPVAVAEDPSGDVVVGLADGDVLQFPVGGVRVKLFNVHNITSVAMDDAGNSYTASYRYHIIIMHVQQTGRDVVVNRGFRSLTGMTSAPSGELWVTDLRSIGLFKIVPSPFHTQL